MTKEQELNDLLSADNPFGCGHARRFIWRGPAGVTACAACRMFVAEKMEQETISRAEVAAALNALREKYHIRTIGGASETWGAAFDLARQELDATVAALRLGAQEKDEF